MESHAVAPTPDRCQRVCQFLCRTTSTPLLRLARRGQGDHADTAGVRHVEDDDSQASGARKATAPDGPSTASSSSTTSDTAVAVPVHHLPLNPVVASGKRRHSSITTTKTLTRLLECSICADTMDDPVSLPRCGHTFCKGCINRWLRNKRAKGTAWVASCPLCKQKVWKTDNLQVNYTLKELAQLAKTRTAVTTTHHHHQKQ